MWLTEPELMDRLEDGEGNYLLLTSGYGTLREEFLRIVDEAEAVSVRVAPLMAHWRKSTLVGATPNMVRSGHYMGRIYDGVLVHESVFHLDLEVVDETFERIEASLRYRSST